LSKFLCLLFCLIELVPSPHAEARWCSIVGKADADTVKYPVIAVAARISGVVVSRLTFTPSGKVTAFEEISGPKLLASTTGSQLREWTVKTDAQGEELCQALVVIDYKLVAPDSNLRPGAYPRTPGILRISVEAMPVLSAPMP